MKAKNRNNRILLTALIYGAVAAFCLLFGTVYEKFSHGVYSPFMYLAFLIPLVGGVLPYVILRLTGAPFPSKASMKLHASGVATLTVGSILQGALEIYGTTNALMIVYPIAGALLLALGAVTFFSARRR